MISADTILHEQHDLSNFPQLCRLCGNLKDSVVSIYDETKSTNYCEVINTHISSIQISRTDILPLKLCIDCLTSVISWHEFHKTCVQVDQKLRAVIKKFNITKPLNLETNESTSKVTNDIEVIEVVGCENYEFYNDDTGDYKESILIDESIESYDDFKASDTADISVTENQRKNFADKSPEKNILIIVEEKYSTNDFGACDKKRDGNDAVYDMSSIMSGYSDSLSNDDKSKADEFLVDVSELSDCRRWSGELNSYDESVLCSGENSSLLKSFVLKDDTSLYHCASCFVACSTKGQLLKHIRTKHTRSICRSELYECDMCPEMFTRNESRNRHRTETHRAEELLAADFRVVRTNEYVAIENEKHDSFSCRYCNKKFTLMGKLRLHKMRKHGVMYENARRCSICSLIMLDKRALQLHLKMVHGTVPKTNSDDVLVNEEYLGFLSKRVVYEDETRYFQCEECPYKCRTVQRLLRHGRRHVISSPTCFHCLKSFSTKSLLKRHITLVHMGIKRFPCPECGKMFGERRHMQEHRNLHRELCSYICEVCGKQFKQAQSIRVHMQMHRGKKSYHCEYCEKAFTFRSKLLNHMKRHTGKNLSVCVVCDKTFTSSSHLKTHMSKHSDVKAFSCDVCNKAFKTNRTLKQHVIAVHANKNKVQD